jgi:hypothetical protein
LASRIEAYLDWSPNRPSHAGQLEERSTTFFPHAQILVHKDGSIHTVISAARGGIFKRFGKNGRVVTDAGLIVETTDGRVAVSQWHDLHRQVEFSGDPDQPAAKHGNIAIRVSGPLYFCRFDTATPLSQAMFHTGMWLVGRWCRGLVRRVLQRRLITHRRAAPVRLTRSFDLLPGEGDGAPALRVTDLIELTDPEVRVKRMAFGTDHQVAYVAACGVYQRSVLHPWTDLADRVHELNEQRRLTIVRRF